MIFHMPKAQDYASRLHLADENLVPSTLASTRLWSWTTRRRIQPPHGKFEIVRVLNNADVKQKFFNAGQETKTSSSEELAVTMRSEIARLGKVIRDAGIRID
jgi:hypothetical protein